MVPDGPETVAWIDLYNSSVNEDPIWIVNLAQNIDAHAGLASVEVPNVPPGSYFVMGTNFLESLAFLIDCYTL